MSLCMDSGSPRRYGLRRSSSAPSLWSSNEEWMALEEEAFRQTPEYARWYYSQSPREPRLPPPVVNCDTYQEIVRTREELNIPATDISPKQDACRKTCSAINLSLRKGQAVAKYPMPVHTGHMPVAGHMRMAHGTLPALVDDNESTCSSARGRNSPEHSPSASQMNTPVPTMAGTGSLNISSTGPVGHFGGLNSKATPFVPQDAPREVQQDVPHSYYHMPFPPQHGNEYSTSAGTPLQSPLTPLQSPISPVSLGYPSPSTPLTSGLPQTSYPVPSYATYDDRLNGSMSGSVSTAMSINVPVHSQSPQNTPQQQPLGQQYAHGVAGGQGGHFLPSSHMVQQSSSHTQPQQTQHRRRPSRPRSKMMEEYRATSTTAHWELKQLEGYVVEFTTDQEGSRLIQRKLEQRCSPDDLQLVFREVLPVALQLMQDVFGNYVIQKLLEYGTNEMRRALIKRLRGNILMLTLQTYGCRIVQKALEVMTDEERLEMVQELDGQVPRCVQDQNGNHVIQKCIEVMSTRVEFIVEAFVGRVAEFATHAYGCRCVQRILEYCKNQKEIIPILDEVLQSVQTLVTDQYGNYVVQHVIINGQPQHQYAITARLKGSFSVLSTHKFASNVVEKMFEYAGPTMRVALLEEMTSYIREDGVSGLIGAVIDQYGNYVMQKIFDLCDEMQKTLVVEHLRPNVSYLRRAAFGKHFVTRLEKQGCLAPPSTPTTPLTTPGATPPTTHMTPPTMALPSPQITPPTKLQYANQPPPFSLPAPQLQPHHRCEHGREQA